MISIFLTCGPPIINSPHGLIWTMVSSVKYLGGMTSFITLFKISVLKSSNDIFSLCCNETTTVWTLSGMHAPWSNLYSHVTYHKQNKIINVDFWWKNNLLVFWNRVLPTRNHRIFVIPRFSDLIYVQVPLSMAYILRFHRWHNQTSIPASGIVRKMKLRFKKIWLQNARLQILNWFWCCVIYRMFHRKLFTYLLQTNFTLHFWKKQFLFKTLL